MNCLEFFTNFKQDHRLQNAIKFDLLVWPTFEIISNLSMHNVYWDMLYITAGNIHFTELQHKANAYIPFCVTES